MLQLIVLSLLMVFSNQMFAPRKERTLQAVKIQNPILEIPVTQKISFQEFKSSQNKQYNSQNEELYRMLVYNMNIQKIQSHNEKLREKKMQNNQGYTMEINQFSDLTEKQFRLIYTKTYPSSEVVVEKSNQVVDRFENLPEPCKGCPRSNFSYYADEGDSELNDKIFEIVRQSQRLKEQQSKSELYALLQKAKNDFPMLSDPSLNIPSIINPEIDIPSIDLSQTISSDSSDQQLDFVMLTDNYSRLLQKLTNQIQNIEIDWTTVSGSIKYQGECGSCYAFATADAVSAMNSIYKFGFNIQLSTQQIVDCSSNGLTYGCDGGFLEGSYAYIKTNGLTTNFQYKYTGKKSDCKIDNGTFKISTFKTLPQGQCNTIIQQLKKKPIAIAIAAYRLRFYSTGVFDDCNSYIDHAVLLVGYKSGVGWKIKNTWGTNWGMNGYAWIKDGNNCGICQNAVTATIAEEPVDQKAANSGKTIDNTGPNIDQKLGNGTVTNPIETKDQNNKKSPIQSVPVFLQPKTTARQSSLKGVSETQASPSGSKTYKTVVETKIYKISPSIVSNQKDSSTQISTAKTVPNGKK